MALCADAAAQAYLAWLGREGAVLNGVSLATFPGTGRGVVALRALCTGETVVSVPDDLALLADAGRAASALAQAGVTQARTGRHHALQSACVCKQHHARSAAADTRNATPFVRCAQDTAPRMKREALVLALMAELAAGRESRWAPYLVRAGETRWADWT